jgi:hypothetical protein
MSLDVIRLERREFGGRTGCEPRVRLRQGNIARQRPACAGSCRGPNPLTLCRLDASDTVASNARQIKDFPMTDFQRALERRET